VWKHIQREDWVLAYHSFNPWPSRLWPITEPYQYSSGSGGGGVGYGIGGSIGVALANRGTGRICVDLQADGDLLYATSALWTVSRCKLPLLMVMHNNRSYYNSEEHGGNIAAHRGRPVDRKGVGTQIVDPAVDFATVARGFGISAEGPIEDPAKLGPAIERALQIVKGGRPALVDVVTKPR
jgi:acetolactate synthase I/II/III large subunit